MSERKRGLGRGLSALMADIGEPAEAGQTQQREEAAKAPDRVLPVEAISANPEQPRRHYEEGDLAELAASIRQHGILQPLIVRPHPDGAERYQIVAGERRWRAAQRAQLHEIPVIVRDLSDLQMLEIAIVENVQRADLNPMEEAAGYRQLMEGFGHTQERLATALGKSRSHIANQMRLLQLPSEVRDMVAAGQLSAGHARALVTAEAPLELARKAASQGLSVRQVEKLAKSQGEGGAGRAAKRPRHGAGKDADTAALERDLSANLGLDVAIDHQADGQGGKLTIAYRSLDDLDNLCRVLSLSPAGADI